MVRKPATKTALFNLGIVASLIAWLAVMVNKHAFDPLLYSALLFALALATTVLAWWYEALKERQLGELELAAASFGARWGVTVLGMTILLFLFVPPLQDAIVLFADAYEGPLPTPAGVFLFGFVFAMILQMTSKSVLGAVWMWTKR